MVSRIEALLDAIGRFHGTHNPESSAYILRNPLLIKSFAKPGKHETDSEGVRVFNSFLSGYKASLFDLDLKIKGMSRAKLVPTDLLENLLRVYGISEKVPQDAIVAFLRRALKDQSISIKTALSYFLETK